MGYGNARASRERDASTRSDQRAQAAEAAAAAAPLHKAQEVWEPPRRRSTVTWPEFVTRTPPGSDRVLKRVFFYYTRTGREGVVVAVRAATNFPFVRDTCYNHVTELKVYI